MEKQITNSLTKSSYSYESINKLGEGALGTVYKGKNLVNNQVVAIKCILNKQIEKLGGEIITAIGQEVNILQSFKLKNKCPYIIEIYDCFQTPSYIYSILEYCDEGTLAHEIQKRKIIPEEHARNIMKQIIEGVKVLHMNQIVHRDIKPDNIFKKKGIYKLGDFGFAAQRNTFASYVGTEPYMAPEILLGHCSYDFKVDIWAMGIVFYQMLYGALPFKNDLEICKKPISFPTLGYEEISKEAKDLLMRMLERKPMNRPSASECLKHEFIAKVKEYGNGRKDDLSVNGGVGAGSSVGAKEKIKEKGYITEKLGNYIDAWRSTLEVVKNLRKEFKNETMITQYMIIKRSYYYLKVLDDDLCNKDFPKHILNIGVSDVWKDYLTSREYLELKSKLAKLVPAMNEAFIQCHEKFESGMVNLGDSAKKRAVNKDINQDFSNSFKMILEDEIINLKSKTLTPSENSKEYLMQLILDLKYVLFIDSYANNPKSIILHKQYDDQRKLRKISEIEEAINNDGYFTKYLDKLILFQYV